MRVTVSASAGYQYELKYVKAALFDYLADYDYLDIDGIPAEQFIERVNKLRPIFSIDDVLNYAVDEGVSLKDSLAELEDQAASM